MDWDFSVISDNVDVLLFALGKTLVISISSIVIGSLLGIMLGVGSLSSNKITRGLTKIFIEIFLALPVLVIIIWLYFCLPLISHHFLLSGETVAIISLALSLSAFVAEIVRAGINSISKGQMEVAYCLGFTRHQALRYILIPQAFRLTLPALMGQFITCYKMSTLASVVGVNELLHTSGNLIAQTYRPMEMYTALAIIFLVTTYPLNRLVKRFERTSEMGGVEKI